MILEVKLKNGKKCVFGGNFMFSVNEEKHLYVHSEDNCQCFILKNYPTYNVGGSMIYCEEIEEK